MNRPTLLPGKVFAGYRIERVLGHGGMGTVYVATHPRLPRRDAVKVLAAEHSTDPEFRARFIREAELASRLDHPNVIGVYDRGVEQDQLWIAMRFVDGPDAATLIRHRASELTPARVVHIIEAASRGLDHAHRAGMLHRDVKPANILIESIPGHPDRVAVADFGIAKAVAATTALTQAGEILATVAYAAPEQLTGAAIDHRADIYALGCTLYELLTGAKPFPRASTDAVIMAHLQDPPPRPTDVAPELPARIDDVIARALAKDPQRRYATCGELAAAATAALGLSQAPATPPARRPARRVSIGVGVVAAVAMLMVATSYLVLKPDSNISAGAVATSTTGPVDPDSWAAHERLITAFPQLLPATQSGSGYQGLRCVAIDLDQRMVDVRQSRDAMNSLACNGNRDPVNRIVLRCGIDALVAPFVSSKDSTPVGAQDWQRPSGRGHISWNDTISVGESTGELIISFADPPRANCSLGVSGGSSGQDLYDRWWLSAPI